MTEAEKLLPGESLRQGFPKLNMMIDMVNYFQKQIDQMVVDGDSSVEAAQARVDGDGTTYTTLKERLDTEHSEVSSQLAQKEKDINERFINVKQPPFNAKGDGVSDDSQAFIDLFTYVSNQVTSSSVHNNQIGSIRVIIPAGEYLITKPIFITPTVRSYGLAIEGVGKYLTRIKYQPTDNTQPLITNNDKWLGITIANISFYGTVDANFMLSDSDGGAQNYSFMNVTWQNWNKCIELTGSNNNSEMSWYHCNWNGVVKKGLFVGATDTSDQFLNYNFFACNFEVSEGDFIDMAKGGNINVYGGSFIHTTTGAAGGTFFNLKGNSHARGVQRLLVDGLRFEHRNNPNSKVINSEWGWGNITFRSCDGSANEDGTGDTHVRYVFNAGNAELPIVRFEDCQIPGVTEYHNQSSSHSYLHNIIYDGCIFFALSGTKTLKDVIKVINTGSHGNLGGNPVIKIRESKGKDQIHQVNTDLYHEYAKNATLSKKIISIKNAQGRLPFNGLNETVTLPIGSIVRKVYFMAKPQGVSTSIGTYTLETTETTPTAITSHTTGYLREGFDVEKSVYHVCDSIEKATLRLKTDSAVNVAMQGHILVEYIG